MNALAEVRRLIFMEMRRKTNHCQHHVTNFEVETMLLPLLNGLKMGHLHYKVT